MLLHKPVVTKHVVSPRIASPGSAFAARRREGHSSRARRRPAPGPARRPPRPRAAPALQLGSLMLELWVSRRHPRIAGQGVITRGQQIRGRGGRKTPVAATPANTEKSLRTVPRRRQKETRPAKYPTGHPSTARQSLVVTVSATSHRSHYTAHQREMLPHDVACPVDALRDQREIEELAHLLLWITLWS